MTVARPRKIAMVLNSYVAGGVEDHCVLLTSRLEAYGYSPTVVYKACSALDRLSIDLESAAVDRISYDVISPGMRRQARGVVGLARFLRIRCIDLVHVQLVGSRGGRVPIMASALARLPVVVTHHLAPSDPLDRLQRLCRSASLTHVSRFICVSEDNRARHVGAGCLPKDKTVCIHNGVEMPDRVDHAAGVHAELCHAVGLSGDARIVGAVGRITEQKGLRWLIAAVPGLVASVPNAHVVLVGEGELRAELEAQARSLDIGDHVHWLGYRADAKTLLLGFDVLAMPSMFEGLPMVLLEAMAAGLPVVAHAVNGIPEAVVHGHTGFLVDVGDVDEFTRRLVEVLGFPHRAAMLGRNARNRAREHFEAGSMARRTAEIYDEVLDSRARRIRDLPPGSGPAAAYVVALEERQR
jgi:glycosyltransferase involved in cell wall biosynthesis